MININVRRIMTHQIPPINSSKEESQQPTITEQKTIGSLKGRTYRAFYRSALSSFYLFFVTLFKPFVNFFSRGNKEELFDKKKIAIIGGAKKQQQQPYFQK